MSVDVDSRRTADEPGGDGALPFVDELATEVVRLIKLSERKAAQLGNRRGDGLERAAYGVLFRVGCEGPQRSSAVAESLGADPSTISRHVAQLVERGYLERTADPIDGRATLLRITAAGQEQCREVRARRNDAFGHVVRDWSLADRRTLVHLMGRLTAELDRARPPGATTSTNHDQHHDQGES